MKKCLHHVFKFSQISTVFSIIYFFEDLRCIISFVCIYIYRKMNDYRFECTTIYIPLSIAQVNKLTVNSLKLISIYNISQSLNTMKENNPPN